MSYLIAKYALIFLLAAVFGFLLGRWWLKRKFVDVTESYETLSTAVTTAPWDELKTQIGGIEQQVQRIPQPEPVDLVPLNQRLGNVEQLIANLPTPVTPEPVNLMPLNQRIDALEALIKGLPKPEKPQPVDLTPLQQRLRNVEQLIADLPTPETPETINLNPLNQRVDRIEALIKGLPVPEKSASVDLAPLDRRIGGVESAVRAIEIPAAPSLSPINDRLQIIEAHLTELKKQTKSPARPPRTLHLLRSAEFGPKDDLKRISGVGPKLERLLNSHGVYYFWQVADWTAQDIKTMDDRLDVFKGRITRDEWTRQAHELARDGKAAVRPDAGMLDNAAHA